MPNVFRRLLVLWCLWGAATATQAADLHSAAALSPALAIDAGSPLSAGTVELKFREFFKLPVGPKGLAPSPRLLSLEGQRVRVVGYMVRQEQATDGLFILTPLPVTLGDEDESFSDDLPVTSLYVHLAPADRAVPVPFLQGLISVSGVLALGAMQEADGRMSFVRLQMDADRSRALAGAAR